MDKLRETLAPLTDWMPPEVRDRLDVEVWWLILLTAALLTLLVLGRLLRGVGRALFGRRDGGKHWERDLREDLEALPLPVRPPGDMVLSVYHLPARLRLLVVAAAGKELELDPVSVEKVLARLVPGLGAVFERDRPRVRVWPPQISHHGFTATFHRCTPKPEGEGEPSRWVFVAGRTLLARQTVLLGLGLWADEPCTLGRINLEPHQWLDVLRLRAADQ